MSLVKLRLISKWTDATLSEMDNIARRTRSHLSIDDQILNDNLDLPDIDQNLYQSQDQLSDPEYKDFLYQCYSEALEQTNDTNNTDDNDPAYVYNDDIFSHGWKFNLDEAQERPAISKEQQQQLDAFGPDFARILNQQLRQHVQLLAQTYLLTKCTKTMQNEAAQAKEHLNSYSKTFNQRRKPSNLTRALELVNNFETPKELKSGVRYSWRHLPVPEEAKVVIDQNQDVFPYVNLLPQVAYTKLPGRLVNKKQKMSFTLNEDKLLTIALDEFKGETSIIAYVASLLLASKNKIQISNHIKNIKRSPGNEDNPIKLYFQNGRLPRVDHEEDSRLRHRDEGDQKEEPPAPETVDMDDLMTASTTISKQANVSERNIKNVKLRKSMVDLLTQNFSLTDLLGDLIVGDFLKEAREKLGERNHLHLLQLLTELMRKESKTNSVESSVKIYHEIMRFLLKNQAPRELRELLVLFLNLESATKCGCAFSYLHWLHFFKFIHYLTLHHDAESIEKKLNRLIDALQKEDSHKIKLAIANLVNKHPLLMREYDSLSLEAKPHSSLFINEEDFDDITEPLNDPEPDWSSPATHYENFNCKLTTDETKYASQSCICKCHRDQSQQQQQHCSKCNIRFIKGRIYIVNKIKPSLAEWSYAAEQAPPSVVTPATPATPAPAPPTPTAAPSTPTVQLAPSALLDWTFEEDKEILEFCQAKADQSNDDNTSFDSFTFEELVSRKGAPLSKRSARDVAKRFNQLMEMYKRD